MEAIVRKKKIMDATMQIVAEKGLETFSVIQVSKRTHINEALIYRDFGTKENLLFECYNEVAKEVAALYENPQKIDMSDPNAMVKACHDIFIQYFSFLVKNSYKTIYYQSYRDSEHIMTYILKEKNGQAASFDGFKYLILPITQIANLPEGMTMDYVWTYIMDTSGIFAKRIIRKELPDTEESYEAVWKLLFTGLAGLM